MKQRFLSFFSLAALLSLAPVLSWAQFTSTQDFEGTTLKLSYTQTPINAGTGKTYTGNSGLNALETSNNNIYPEINVATSPVNSFGIVNNTSSGATGTIINFAPFKLISGASSSISYRLSAYAIGNGNSGLTNTGSAVLSIAINGSSTYTDFVTVTGSSNGGAYWDYAAASVSTNYPTTRNIVVPTGTTGNSGSSGGGVGTVTLNIPSGFNITQVAIRITLIASNKSALLIDDVTVNSSSPLPVTLTSFTASRQSSNVYVKWATATEKNNAYFEVQRSNDGKSFTAVGKVTGNGTTATGASYSFTDRNPLAATSYYRLRQVDNDATESYSSVVAVSGADKIEASFYPNPSNSLVTLPAVSGLVKYRVYTATGQNVATGEAQGGSEVSLQQVPAGIYFLELITAGKHNVQRFVKQ